jgi:putative addiction module component (TIGR02574 family)
VVVDTLQQAIRGLSPLELVELRAVIDGALDQERVSVESTDEQKAMIASRAAELAADPSVGLTSEEMTAWMREEWPQWQPPSIRR